MPPVNNRVWCLGKCIWHIYNNVSKEELWDRKRDIEILPHTSLIEKIPFCQSKLIWRVWKITYGFFTVEPIHLTIWTRSTPAIKERIIHFFPYLTKCKILAGHSVDKILTHSTTHSHSLQKTVSAEVSSHKSVREAITIVLKKGVKTQCSDAILVCNSDTLIN